MEISKEALQEYKDIFKKEYGKDLTDAEAYKSAIRLLNFCKIGYDFVIDNPTTNICGFECIADEKRRKELLGKIYSSKGKLYSVLNDELRNNPLVELSNSKVFYAPVGNYHPSPTVIICGKTTSNETRNEFWKTFETQGIYSACFKTSYSNMRNNLFTYLWELGLFDKLKITHKYWASRSKEDCLSKWKDIFENMNSVMPSGIRVTQAINCAIINNSGAPANEPQRPTVEEFFQKAKVHCGLISLKINPELKLIVFLDTPGSMGQFHPIEYFQPKGNVKLISITHPSGQNNVVFKYLSDRNWGKMGRKGKKAKTLFETATQVINEINWA